MFGTTRYYAVVFTAEGNDLAELLVRNGPACIYGTRTPLPDGTDSYTGHFSSQLASKSARAGREQPSLKTRRDAGISPIYISDLDFEMGP